MKRAQERRNREDKARRLRDAVPALASLRLEIVESEPEAADDTDVRHARLVVVDRAPALFRVPCSAQKCDGEHDLTRPVLAALRAGRGRFDGTHVCGGTRREEACGITLAYSASATYSG